MNKKKLDLKTKFYLGLQILVILAFLLIILYSMLRPKIDDNRREKIIQQLMKLIEDPEPQILEGMVLPNGLWVDVNHNPLKGEIQYDFASIPAGFEAGTQTLIQPTGILKIESIDLKLPILNSSTIIDLRYGIGRWKYLDPIESLEGRTVLFGHHLDGEDKYFSKLEKVKKNDSIVIEQYVNGSEIFRAMIDDDGKIVMPKKYLLMSSEIMPAVLSIKEKDKVDAVTINVNIPGRDMLEETTIEQDADVEIRKNEAGSVEIFPRNAIGEQYPKGTQVILKDKKRVKEEYSYKVDKSIIAPKEQLSEILLDKSQEIGVRELVLVTYLSEFEYESRLLVYATRR